MSLTTFYFMWKDEVTCKIETDFFRTIKATHYPCDYWKRCVSPHYDTLTMEELDMYLEDRCIPRHRDGIKDWLAYNNIPFYDPLLIIYLTHGVMLEDFNWIKFEGEDLTFEDVRIR